MEYNFKHMTESFCNVMNILNNLRSYTMDVCTDESQERINNKLSIVMLNLADAINDIKANMKRRKDK